MTPEEASRGPAAASRIPPAGIGQIDAEYCLWFLRQIRDCTFATVDAACLHCGLCFEACPHGAIEKG